MNANDDVNKDQFGFSRDIAGGKAIISLRGPIDERADLVSPFAELQTDTLIINMRRVSRVNSTGVRNWINSTKPLFEKYKIEFVECPRSIVDQLNMINNFFSSGKIISFYAPYYCEDCEKEHDVLLAMSEHFKTGEDRQEPEAPDFKCPECGGNNTELAEDEDKYFSFLKSYNK